MNHKVRSLFIVLLVAGIVLVLDRLTKLWVLQNIELYGSWAPIAALASYFRIIHTTNTGVAFGLFRGGGGLFAIVAAIAVIAILVYSYRLPQSSSPWLYLALGLLLGGAAGNLWDRLVHDGHVIDFLNFQLNDRLVFPTFNVADSALVVGVISLILLMWGEERRAKRAAQAERHDLSADVGA